MFPSAFSELSYRIAFGCWFFPLVAGIGNFFLWLMLRWKFLENLGVVIVVAGFAAASFSLVFGGYFVICRVRAGARLWKEALAPAIGLLALLFLSLFLTGVLCGIAYGSTHW